MGSFFAQCAALTLLCVGVTALGFPLTATAADGDGDGDGWTVVWELESDADGAKLIQLRKHEEDGRYALVFSPPTKSVTLTEEQFHELDFRPSDDEICNAAEAILDDDEKDEKPWDIDIEIEYEVPGVQVLTIKITGTLTLSQDPDTGEWVLAGELSVEVLHAHAFGGLNTGDEPIPGNYHENVNPCEDDD